MTDAEERCSTGSGREALAACSSKGVTGGLNGRYGAVNTGTLTPMNALAGELVVAVTFGVIQMP